MTYRLRAGIFLIALCTLVLELSLVRVFDVILTPTMGYAVVTSAVFSLGLGGIYLYIMPLTRDAAIKLIPWLFIIFALSTLALLPIMNALPFKLNLGATAEVRSIGDAQTGPQIFAWLLMYLTLITPFFVAGLIISIILSHYSEQVHSLYFFDLIGAGIGCVLLIPLLKPYGPGGIQMLVAGFALAGAPLFLKNKGLNILLVLSAMVFVLYPATMKNYLEYEGHANKRGTDTFKNEGKREYVKWGPVSKLEVFDSSSPDLRNFAIDGGQQGSWMQKFDGDFTGFEDIMRDNPDDYYFGMNSVVHYFKQGTQAKVLIIGAAVGSETRAAVLFGAKKVDAIELVDTTVNAAKTLYNEFSGGIFNHPRVNYQVGEGRTFLRNSGRNYDIIQMFSNQTSSSIANGIGAVGAAYLQTVEAYKEYYTHLSDNGMMQINRHIYPRILTTAAEAWKQLGRTDFSAHVLVMERWVPDTLPATFIKMQPWTDKEVQSITNYMNREEKTYRMPETRSGKSAAIYGGHPLKFNVVVDRYPFKHFSIFVSTDRSKPLNYDLNLKIYDGDKLLISKLIPGDTVRDRKLLAVEFDAIRKTDNKQLRVELSSNSTLADGISLWLAEPERPHASFRGIPTAYVVAFDPTEPDDNLIPATFLDEPFNFDLAATAAYKLTPVTDDNPYFGMLRKSPDEVSRLTSPFMDYGTEYFLNVQQLPFLTSDWLNLFIVAAIATAFSFVFIFTPLFFSKHGRARWPKMSTFLAYFCCLGAGFILIELTFIQLFMKLIGFPTHTYATVLFSLLISAGLGSLASKSLVSQNEHGWKILFSLILSMGLLFIFSYEWWFSIFLEQALPIRILAAIVMLFPMGFLMGMPFPVAISKLGKLEPGGIPWAWAMNGFFTVFGGFLSVLIAFTLGFRVTLFIGVAIYLLAFYLYSKIHSVAVN